MGSNVIQQLHKCNNGHEVLHVCGRIPGAEIIPGHGSHKKVKNTYHPERRPAIVPDHRENLGKGIKCAIWKQIAELLGLALGVLLLVNLL